MAEKIDIIYQEICPKTQSFNFSKFIQKQNKYNFRFLADLIWGQNVTFQKQNHKIPLESSKFGWFLKFKSQNCG